MSHYKSNLRDVQFNLFEYLKLGDMYGTPPFDSFDEDTAMDALREVDRLAREDFAASFVDSDRVPVVLEDGEVKLPESMHRSLDAMFDGGWHLLGIGKDLGGFDAPNTLRWGTTELLVGANPSAFLYASGGLMARVIA